MPDVKQLDPIKLVAVERGFIGGAMVEPGASFWFDPTPSPNTPAKKLTADGKQLRIPKWAALPGDPRINKPKPKAGDLKPKAAQTAVKTKAAALTGSDLA